MLLHYNLHPSSSFLPFCLQDWKSIGSFSFTQHPFNFVALSHSHLLINGHRDTLYRLGLQTRPRYLYILFFHSIYRCAPHKPWSISLPAGSCDQYKKKKKKKSVTSLQAQTFNSCKASLFVYIGLLGMFWRTWPIVAFIMLYWSDYRHIYISEHSWLYMLQL